MDAEFSKETVKIPFNTYDLFGYFIPGAVLLLAVYFFELLFWWKHIIPTDLHLPLLTVINEAGNLIIDKKNWVVSAIFLIVLVIIVYAVGHIISAISTFLLDRVLISKGYGYPYESFLKIEKSEDEKLYRRNFYKGLFFWVNLYLLLYYYFYKGVGAIYNIFYPHPNAINPIVVFVYWYIIIMVSFKFFISSKRIEDNPKLPRFLRNILMKIKDWLSSQKTIIPMKVFASPYNLLSRFLSGFVGSKKPEFPEEFINQYKKYFSHNFKLESDKADTNNYWLSKCFVAHHSPSLNAMLVNWLHMYSYARNLATSFYLAFIYCFASLVFQNQSFRFSNDPLILFYLPVFFFFLSLVMLIWYYYLYFSCYSKFLFRAFYFLNQPPIEKSHLSNFFEGYKQ